MVMEWFPAPSAKLPLEMFGSARAGTGSSPASAFPIGVEVVPRETPKSNTSNWSPAVNASVTVKVVPPAGATKVQGGASRNTLGVPELGMPNGPAGWLGSRRVAGTPGAENPNSSQVSNGTGPAAAGEDTRRKSPRAPSLRRSIPRKTAEGHGLAPLLPARRFDKDRPAWLPQGMFHLE